MPIIKAAIFSIMLIVTFYVVISSLVLWVKEGPKPSLPTVVKLVLATILGSTTIALLLS